MLLLNNFQKPLGQGTERSVHGKYCREEKKLTQRIPHPVGTNARMLANMSVTERSVSRTATVIPAIANKKEMP
ncbi:hypothetical protein SAY86_026487 [Trapa natans]|uniref:Uncharacterized protein n=1 Tax=Trapa natans TaxID=22666 RepID=A0AAN7KLT0_TRANT|nr:hypothetical protein SAY86_026487 [Trapa natans]